MPILKRVKNHKLLLDTHVWLWCAMGSSKILRSFRQIYEHASTSHRVFVSPMTIWEIGMLSEKNRIEVDMDVLDWIEEALDSSGADILPITPRIAIQSSKFEGEVHGDPVDRLLIATAFENNAVLVTCDKKILKYAEGKFISAFNPCK